MDQIWGDKLKTLRSAVERGVDFVLPPRCYACGDAVEAQGNLCGTCWGRLHFISVPQCQCCGLPFEFENALSENYCGACLHNTPPYDWARAALRYDEGSKPLILAFKHADRMEAVLNFARMMVRPGGDYLKECDVIIPVPLYRWRLWRRRYNQAALIAQKIAEIVEKPVDLLSLKRDKATASQGHLSRRKRALNVRGAFSFAPSKLRGLHKPLSGKKVVLVDDVYTTGATVMECAKVLKKAGAEEVGVLTLARVVRPNDATNL